MVECNNPEFFKTEIPVLGKVVGDIYASPDELFFEMANHQREINRKIQICSRKKVIREVNIDSKSSSLEKILQSKIKKTRDGFQLLATLFPYKISNNNDLIKGVISLRVETEQGENWTVNVPILGIVKKFPK